MIKYAVIFLLLTLAALVLGFLAKTLVGVALLVAKICFFVFLGLFLIFLALTIYKKDKKKKG